MILRINALSTKHVCCFSLQRLSETFPILTYLLTPWNRVLLEKLTGSAASQEIPRIFGTRRFITVLTSSRHLSLSWANSIQSPQPPPTSWRSILILSSHLRLGLPNGLFPSGPILILIQQDTIIYAYSFSCKVPVILVRIWRNLNFLDRFLKSIQISSFKKFLPVGAEIFHADGRTDRHDVANTFTKYFTSSENRINKIRPLFPFPSAWIVNALQKRIRLRADVPKPPL